MLLEPDTKQGKLNLTSNDFCKNCTPELRQYIVDLSKSFTRDKTAQKDLLYTAWLVIDQEYGDSTEVHYMELAHSAMLRKYKLYYLKHDRAEADGYIRESRDTGVRRAKKKLRFFKRVGYKS